MPSRLQPPPNRPSPYLTDHLDCANSLPRRPVTPVQPSSSSTGNASSVDLPAFDATVARGSNNPGRPDVADASSSGDSTAEDMEMEPLSAGHRRRRSSLMNPAGRSPNTTTTRPTRNVSQSTRAPLQDDAKISEEQADTDGLLSDGIDDDGLSDEDLHDDEETGLTKKDKRRKRHKRNRNTRLDQRIAQDNITKEEQKEADQNVLKTLVINGTLIGLWYLFSLCISLYNKWMFDHNKLNFPFPLFTTSAHMLVQFALSCLVLYFVPSLRPQAGRAHSSDLGRSRHESEPERTLMTKMFYLTRIGPCGAATGLDIGLGNTSLKFITLTFYTMCKSSALAFVLLFAFLFRLETPTWKLVGIIALMTAGVVMMVAGEVEFKLGGFILVISAAFFSGFRWGLTQILLLRNPATSNPISSIFFLAPVMFFTLLFIAIPVEGVFELAGGLKELAEAKGALVAPLLLLFPGTIAFLMTASEFALLQRTSVVTLSIAGIFKEVVTIGAAALVFHDQLTPINISGLFITLGAIAGYNYIKITKMRADAQRDAHKGNADSGPSPYSGESDAELDAEETGLLRHSTDIEDHLMASDGSLLPNPQATGDNSPTKLPNQT